MNIAICKKIFGGKHNLIISGEDYIWSEIIPQDSWVIGGNIQSPPIEVVCELFNIEPPSFLSNEQVLAFSTLGIKKNQIPAVYIQKKSQFKLKLDDVIRSSSEAIEHLANSGYMETFYREQKVLRGLSAGKIDYSSLHSFFNEKSNKKRIGESVLKSFCPNDTGFMNSAIYSTVNTSTGRMTIEKGPQILTAPKEVRNFLVSKYPNGKVIQADLVSLEPRVGRILTGGSVERDVYESIGKEVFQGKLTREQVKKSLLCAMYGAGHRTLKSLLPPGTKVKEVTESLREYIDFYEVVKSKKAELRKEGKMKNYFGRPVVPSSDRDSLIYNNWLQSTSVDIALLSFEKLIKKMNFADPIFLIHDAILFDVPGEYLNKAEEIISQGIEISEIGNFPMSYSFFSHN